MKRANTSGKSTSDLLKDAAVSMFGKYGYEGTSVRMIAKEAGLSAGQITANFGSKENLFNEIVMDIYKSTCKDYDPIIGEFNYLKSSGKLTNEDAWRLIEKIVDIQIDFTLDLKNQDVVQILNVHMLNDNTRTSSKLAQLTKSKIEDSLAGLLREVFKHRRRLHVITISRAINGMIVSFAEHPDLLYKDVYSGNQMPQSKEWMKEYIKNFAMDALHLESERIEEV